MGVGMVAGNLRFLGAAGDGWDGWDGWSKAGVGGAFEAFDFLTVHPFVSSWQGGRRSQVGAARASVAG